MSLQKSETKALELDLYDFDSIVRLENEMKLNSTAFKDSRKMNAVKVQSEIRILQKWGLCKDCVGAEFQLFLFIYFYLNNDH